MKRDQESIYRGRLVKDAVFSTKTVGGESKPLLTATIAYKTISKAESGGENQYTSFIDVELWGKGAEFNAGLKKGDRVMVLGETKQHRWKDNEGKSRSTFRINAESIDMIAKRGEKAEAEEPAPSPTEE